MSDALRPVPMLPPAYDGQSTAEREAQLLAWGEQMERVAKEREADGRFAVIGLPDGAAPMAALLYSRCCTDLTDAEATERMNLVPAGTRHGWHLVAEDRDGQPVGPVACDEKPGFRHMLFEC